MVSDGIAGLTGPAIVAFSFQFGAVGRGALDEISASRVEELKGPVIDRLRSTVNPCAVITSSVHENSAASGSGTDVQRAIT